MWEYKNLVSNIILINIFLIGGVKLDEKKEKITLPDELQKEMFKFFLETSIPRKKKELEEKARLLSENQKSDRRDKNDNENGNLC